jgi:pimeloyl-ACP methyl ester carboxylesterase
MQTPSTKSALALAIGLSVAAAAPGRAGTLPPLPPPQAAFDAGMLHVDRFGSSPQVLVLIPGLGCGAWVWAGTIDRFSRDYTIYVITLPGFDGRPMTPRRPLFAAFSTDFWSFLSTAGIEKPVVIGHSLGGTLAIALAEQHPNRLKAIVAVDGLPVFPTLAAATPAERQATATQAAAAYASLDYSQLLAGTQRYMRTIGTNDVALVEPVAELEARSDPAAMAAWMSEDLAGDLRPDLNKAALPVLEIMPYDSADAALPYTQEQSLAFYRALLHGAPQATIEPIVPARHFAMLDQPEIFYQDLADFLATYAPH